MGKEFRRLEGETMKACLKGKLSVCFVAVAILFCASAYASGQSANRPRPKRRSHNTKTNPATSPTAGFPNVDKPQPQWDPTWQCSPEGDGNETDPKAGDPQ